MSKLLIVDDENDVRFFARNYFTRRGIEVITASGGIEALAILKGEMPDLVLLDIRMPDLSGVEVLRDIRQNRANTRVVMVSGIEDEDVIREVKALGVSSFLHKPLILEELEKIVHAQLAAGS